jgi:hypothetical protein
VSAVGVVVVVGGSARVVVVAGSVDVVVSSVDVVVSSIDVEVVVVSTMMVSVDGVFDAVVLVAGAWERACEGFVRPPETAQADPPDSTAAAATDTTSLTARSVPITTRSCFRESLFSNPTLV